MNPVRARLKAGVFLIALISFSVHPHFEKPGFFGLTGLKYMKNVFRVKEIFILKYVLHINYNTICINDYANKSSRTIPGYHQNIVWAHR